VTLDRDSPNLINETTLETRVFLIRHGVTDWHASGRVLGQRDIPLSADGLAQADGVARLLEGIPLAELIASPLARATQTAETIGRRFSLDVARDPRLIDFRLGRWTGMTYDEISANEEYQRFLADPLSERIPDGESLAEIRARAVSAVEQALEDSPSGDAIAIVTHAGIIRVVLAHYLGSHPANYHRIRVSPGSVSVLSFRDGQELPRVLATNLTASLADAMGV
jgi:broad specificity phosphatase PhoE